MEVFQRKINPYVKDDEFQDQLQKAVDSYRTYINFKRKNPRLIMGMPLLKYFNGTMATDLKQYHQKYILRIIDLATTHSSPVLINSRHKDVVEENIIRMWGNTFGVPDKILTDNGRAFNRVELFSTFVFPDFSLTSPLLQIIFP